MSDETILNKTTAPVCESLREFGYEALVSTLREHNDWSKNQMDYRFRKLDGTGLIEVTYEHEGQEGREEKRLHLTEAGKSELVKWKERNGEVVTAEEEEPRMLTKREWAETKKRLNNIEDLVEAVDGADMDAIEVDEDSLVSPEEFAQLRNRVLGMDEYLSWKHYTSQIIAEVVGLDWDVLKSASKTLSDDEKDVSFEQAVEHVKQKSSDSDEHAELID